MRLQVSAYAASCQIRWGYCIHPEFPRQAQSGLILYLCNIHIYIVFICELSLSLLPISSFREYLVRYLSSSLLVTVSLSLSVFPLAQCLIIP